MCVWRKENDGISLCLSMGWLCLVNLMWVSICTCIGGASLGSQSGICRCALTVSYLFFFFLQVLTVACHLSKLFTCGWKTANLGIVWVHMSFYMFVCLKAFLWKVKCVCNSMYVSWWYTVGKWRGWVCRCPQCLWALLAQACLSIFVTSLKFDVSYFQLTVSEP